MTPTVTAPATTTTLTPEAEAETAIAIEAGVLAAFVLAEGSRPDVPDADLSALVELGHQGRNRILGAHAWLVGHVVAQEFRGVGSRDDLLQQAWLAMAEALQRYDHRRGRFSTYAMPFVRAGVRKAVARDQGLTERQSRGRRLIRRAESHLTQSLGRLPGPDDLVAELGRDRGWLLWCDTQHAAVQHELLEAIADRPVPDEASPWPTGLERVVARLPRTLRALVAARFPSQGEPASYEELAAALTVSVSTVRRMERDALARLRTALTSDVAA